MGCVNFMLQGRTDNLISIPLLQEPVAIGRVLAVTSNMVTLDTTAGRSINTRQGRHKVSTPKFRPDN